MVTVPNLLGDTTDVAVQQLSDAGLKMGRIERIESRQREGTIVAQSIDPGRRVTAGSAVAVTIAVPIMVVVPDVVGRDLRSARGILESAGLRMGSSTERRTRDTPGTVLAQAPSSGQRIPVGSAVSAVVAAPLITRVPDLLGRSESEARDLLARAGLRSGTVAERESREPARTVVSQAVAAGMAVDAGTTIDFAVATPIMVLVPNVVGQPGANALRQLSDAGLHVSRTERAESRQPEGSVVSQTPDPGRRVPFNTPVGITIAARPMVRVPNVIGRSEADARRLLEQADLTAGPADHEPSGATAGTVLRQSPDPGTSVALGNPVTLIVAVAETAPVPAVVGMNVDDARLALHAERLAVGTVGLQETRVDRPGVVLAQSRVAGTPAATGTAVDLLVATPAMVVVPNVVGLTSTDAADAIRRAGLPLGDIGRRVSMQPGGTVLAQDQVADTAVVFTTAIGLQVALPRIVWVVPGSLLLAGLIPLALRVRRPRRSGRSNTRVAEPPLHVTPRIDGGEQQVTTTTAAPLLSLEMRVKPVADPGTSSVDADHGIVATERRHRG
jgi:beta-lactam-binding protein with PASTA domain